MMYPTMYRATIQEICNGNYGEEWGYVPSVTNWRQELYYHLWKEFKRLCPKCKTTMTKTSNFDDIFKKLPCRKCSSIMKRNDFLMWD